MLLLAGAAAVLLGSGLLAGVLPGIDPSVPVLGAPPAPPTWAAYAAIVVSVIVGLLCLRWLLAQTQRRPKTGTWALSTTGGTDGRTRIGSDRAADAVVADITGYPGVSKATAHLTGARGRPTLHLDVTADPDASVTELRQQIHDHAQPRLRQALDLDGLSARMVLRLDTSTPSRTR